MLLLAAFLIAQAVEPLEPPPPRIQGVPSPRPAPSIRGVPSPRPPGQAPGVPSPRAAPEPSCSPDKVIRVDLDRWRAQMRSAGPGSEEQSRLLAQLGLFMPGLPQDADQLPCGQQPVLKGVDVFSPRLTGGPRPDRVVQARFEVCPDEQHAAMIALRIQVLQPLGAGTYCRLESELSADRFVRDTPCAGSPQKLPRLLSFPNVTDARRQTLQIKDQGGSCGGTQRSAKYTTALFDVQGDGLAEIFRLDTYEAEYPAPRATPLGDTTRTLHFEGPFPKAIRVSESIGCHSDEEGNPPSDCTPAQTEKTYRFTGGKYVEE